MSDHEASILTVQPKTSLALHAKLNLNGRPDSTTLRGEILCKWHTEFNKTLRVLWAVWLGSLSPLGPHETPWGMLCKKPQQSSKCCPWEGVGPWGAKGQFGRVLHGPCFTPYKSISYGTCSDIAYTDPHTGRHPRRCGQVPQLPCKSFPRKQGVPLQRIAVEASTPAHGPCMSTNTRCR